MRRKIIRTRLVNGEPRDLEDGGAYYDFCCDCELTHFYTVDIDWKKKEVHLCFYRDDYCTDKFRKENGVVVYRRKNVANKKSNTLDKEK